MLSRFRTALGFLTIIPVSGEESKTANPGDALLFFPVVGVIFGIFTWGLLNLLTRFFPAEISVWLTVFAVAILNGCIHWDGFADTADGLGGQTPERSLMIMKDSRLGSFGGIALIFLITGKIFVISPLVNSPLTIFICISVLSRWAMILQIHAMPSVSQGLLKAFQPRHPRIDLLIATLLVFLSVILAWPAGLTLLCSTLITLIMLNRFIKSRFGGITGDILGASNELIELVCFLSLNFKI